MSCYCDDYDPVDIHDERHRGARRRWTCYECGEPIEPGDEYVDVTQLYKGCWYHYRFCDCCWDDWERMVELGHCRIFGDLEATIERAY